MDKATEGDFRQTVDDLVKEAKRLFGDDYKDVELTDSEKKYVEDWMDSDSDEPFELPPDVR